MYSHSTFHFLLSTFLHRSFNLFDGRHGLLIYLIHISLRIARSITLELTLVEGTDKLTDSLLTHMTVRQALTDIIMRQLFDRDIKFIAHIAPEGTQHLVVELTRLVLCHQVRCFLQTFRCHLIGLAGTTLGDIGILDGPLTEDHEQRDKHEGHNGERDPIGHRTEEELVDTLLAHITSLDITDITTQLLQILLTREVCHSTRTRTLCHIKDKRFARHRLIGLGSRIKISQTDRRQLIMTLMTGYDKDIINHRSLDTSRGQFGLISHLGLVFIEVLRQFNLRLFYKFQITNTTDRDTQRDRIISLGLCLIE